MPHDDKVCEHIRQAWTANMRHGTCRDCGKELGEPRSAETTRDTVLEEAALECQRVADIGEGPQGVTRATALWLRDNIRALKEKPPSADSLTNSPGAAFDHGPAAARGTNAAPQRIVEEVGAPPPAAVAAPNSSASPINEDRAYVNGAIFGWNCGIAGDEKKFSAAIDGREAEIHATPSASESPEAIRLLREWMKKANAHPETREFKGGYQPFLERATREFLARSEGRGA